MARARNIKPGFFSNEDLAECSFPARLCFAGLWTLADREGRLEDRPKRIKGELFRFDNVDVEPLLQELQRFGFIARYTVNGLGIIQVCEFSKHQNPHHREPESDLPSQQSPGPDGDGNPLKPRAQAPCNDDEAQGKPEAEDPSSDLARGSSRAESGTLIPDTGFRIPDSGENTATSDEVARARRPDDPQLSLVEGTGKPKVWSPPDCPHLEVLALWAEVLPSMPQHLPKQWKGTRADHLRARWRETAKEKRWPDQSAGLTHFRRLFAYVGQSRFLTGRTPPAAGQRPFVIELEWLVNPTNWAKVIEGKYHQDAA